MPLKKIYILNKKIYVHIYLFMLYEVWDFRFFGILERREREKILILHRQGKQWENIKEM